MPIKRFFTQSACILMDKAPSLDEVARYLTHFQIAGRKSAAQSWAFSEASIIVSFRPEVNGVVVIDVVNRPWPDGVGDAKQDTLVSTAWSMGSFGPFASPGNLERAVQHAWGWDKKKASALVKRHTAFIRIRSSYIFGSKRRDSVVPDDYDVLDELSFVTEIALALSVIPGALCYFNPNGETLCEPSMLSRSVNSYLDGGSLPINIWTNRRIFWFTNELRWIFMDIIGMQQLDQVDLEACFRRDQYDLNNIAHFLLNVALYLLKQGPILKHGDTLNLECGGYTWQVWHFESSLWEPHRPILRLFPLDGAQVPPALLPRERQR